MASQTLEILIQAKDEATKKLSELSNKAKALEPTFKALSVVGVTAFAGISAFAYASIKSSEEAEVAQKQLEHAVIAVSHATEAQLKATEDLAVALEKKGVLDGDNIKMGLAQLSTFGLTNDAVRGLGGSLADLAVNQFGVNATGEQMTQTANMIAKALNGQFGVLEKSGIRFTDAQKHMIEFGTEMEKVDAINQGFAQNLKYTNETALGTMEGQVAKLNVQFDNLKQSIGDQLRPMLVVLLQKISPIILAVTGWIEQNPQLATTILIVAGVISGLVALVGLLGLAIPVVTTGFLALITPVGLVVGAISLVLIPVLAYLLLHFQNIKEQANIVFTFLGELMIAWATKIKQKFDEWMKWLKSWWTVIKEGFNEMVKGIVAYFQPLFDVIDRIKSAVSSVTSAVKSAVSSVSGKSVSGARADGGPVSGGNTYLVGERGPELFTPSGSGSIIPNNALVGGGLVININGGTYLDQNVAKDIGDMIISQYKLYNRI